MNGFWHIIFGYYGGGQQKTVDGITTRLTLLGTARTRLPIVGTSAERHTVCGTSEKRITLMGSNQ